MTDFLSEEKSRHLMDLPEEGKLSCISAGKNRTPGKGLGTKKHTGGTEKKPIPIEINKKTVDFVQKLFILPIWMRYIVI